MSKHPETITLTRARHGNAGVDHAKSETSGLSVCGVETTGTVRVPAHGQPEPTCQRCRKALGLPTRKPVGTVRKAVR